ncbi:hypothetical protein QR680_008735 [Steinernema hermaphroditum]|uniref:ABC-type glutathione-S-conjugate transporter n=1 Tax=Steinernema hermaphroditum TaxID=289476 RepID=A0AA39IK71_9BILA|nr:hypothetical protein QR680_008735 [Steinernema hermaphroditum]
MHGSAFCSTFFESYPYANGSWAVPDASECLQQSVFRLTPAVFLLLTGPILIYRSLCGKDTRGTPEQLSGLIYVKLVMSAVLFLNGFALAVSDFISYVVSPLYGVVFIICLAAVLSLTVLCFYRGVYSSGVLFFFYLCLSLCSVLEFRYRIERVVNEGLVDGYRFFFTILFFPLTLVQTVLYCFSDYRWSLEKDPKSSPEMKSSVVSQLIYGWYTSAIVRGYKKSLVLDDVFHINKKDSSKRVVTEFLKHWNSSPEYEDLDRPEEKSLLWPLCKTYSRELAFVLAMCLYYSIGIFMIPFFVGKIIAFAGDLSQPAWAGLGWAICLFLADLSISLANRQFECQLQTISMNISTTLISMVYSKALNLSNEVRRGRTVGEIVNLMSVDVGIVKNFTDNVMNFVSTPITLSIGVYMLYNLVGVAAFIGFGVLCALIIPCSLLVSWQCQVLEEERMEVRDERVKMTNELLNGIKAVKFYAWEDSMKKLVENLRSEEMSMLKKIVVWLSVLYSTFGCVPLIVTGTTFGSFVLLDPEKNVLTPEIAFMALTINDIIYGPIFELSMVIYTTINFLVSNRRLKSFMSEKQLEPYIDSEPTKEGVASIKNAIFTWEKEKKPVLRDVTVAVKSGELVAVVGEVGCGKSSLIAALLGEMTKESGSVHVAGSVAYVPQQAWIQNGTLRDNVTFGKSFDKEIYDQVIEACAMTPDLEMLAAGDLTEIGEKGINLSGGQKQRVSLARAVYSERDVFLLDDPLSAVDAHVGKHLFERVISSETGLLRGKTRILVTHGIHFLKHCDRVIVLRDGTVSEQGTYYELLASKGAFADYLQEYVVGKVEQRRKTTSIGEELEEDEELNELNTVLKDLGTSQEEAHKQLKSQLSKLSQVSARKENKGKEEVKPELDEVDSEDGRLMQKEQLATGQVKMAVYLNYFRAYGFTLAGFYFASFFVSGAFRILSNLKLAEWSDRSADVANGSNVEVGRELGFYIGYSGAEAVVECTRAVISAFGSLQASRVLHDILLKNVIRLPMSFFDTTPIGRILNRFGRDIEVADDLIPEYMEQAFYWLYETVMSFILVIRGSYYMIPLIAIIVILNVFVVKYYIRTARQLQRLDSITRSPIYSHFQESLQGVTSIRAYKAVQRFEEESQKKTDTNRSAFYYLLITNQWLVVRLEFLGNLIMLCSSLMAVFLRGADSVTAGIVGLAVSHALNISRTLNSTMRMMTNMENNIVSVERIREYASVPTEAPADSEEDKKPAEEWPERGAITIENLQLRYREGLDLVLRGISAKIAPGEKIGIVGRTGAGKSSLTLALFRIVEADSGRILIDGRDISTLGLRELRSKLTIVPQDPVLFSGSFRMNLDPFGEFDDARLWEALRVASLRDFVESLPERLEHEVAEGGENLSVGQRQLVCLARAVLHRTRILVLDEAAAALDLETDALIQRTIREHFRQCTVLTIAHRLNTVVDNDRLLVLERGQVKEFDSPQNLLADRDSLFHSMAKEAGLV